MNSFAFLSIFLLLFLICTYQCLKVIPDRVELTFVNDSYVEGKPTFNVRRYKRKGDYVVNLVFTNKVVLDNTIVLDVIFYQYLHNEFRRSFPEMHYKLCDFIKDDPYIGKVVRDAGLKTCPILPETHSATNISFNMEIPSVWPFEKGMAEFIIQDDKVKAIVAKCTVVLTFQQ